MSALRTLTQPVQATRDVVLLIARAGLGIVFIAHGWQKVSTNGLDQTAAGFERLGIPAPTLSAYFAAGVELIGGAALILGALTAVAGVLLAFTMAGAFYFVHMGKGLFVTSGGWEYVVILGLFCLAIAAVGAGRFSVDRALTRSTAGRATVSA